MKKVTVYRVTQAVWGSSYPMHLSFRTKEERDSYVESHDHLDVERTVRMNADNAEEAFAYTAACLANY